MDFSTIILINHSSTLAFLLPILPPLPAMVAILITFLFMTMTLQVFSAITLY